MLIVVQSAEPICPQLESIGFLRLLLCVCPVAGGRPASACTGRQRCALEAALSALSGGGEILTYPRTDIDRKRARPNRMPFVMIKTKE